VNWSPRALWLRLTAERPVNGRTAAETRQGASDALKAAESVTGEVFRAVTGARNIARRTDRFVREAERSLHRKGSA
jgi:hypothetical protein